MMKELVVIGILVSVLLTSGCVKHMTSFEKNESMGISQVEDQADAMIEQEIEESTENITLEDIENSLVS